MDTARPRFAGSTERLADALEMPTPWGLQFPVRDLATSKEPQLQPHLLLKHTQMVRRLHELQPNLAFKQTHLREAIAVLTKRHPHGRFNDQTFCKDIITTDVNLTTKGPQEMQRRTSLVQSSVTCDKNLPRNGEGQQATDDSDSRTCLAPARMQRKETTATTTRNSVSTARKLPSLDCVRRK